MYRSFLVLLVAAPSWTANLLPAHELPGVELAASRGCGSRGGPGFRGSDGKCVGWANLAKVCGTPPTTHCTHEGGGAGDTTLQGGAAFIAGAAGADAGAKAFNHRSVKRDALACTSPTLLVRVVPCASGKGETSCQAQLVEAVAKGECMTLRGGSEASVEAGSHSFDWLRIRPRGERRELWIERRHVLD